MVVERGVRLLAMCFLVSDEACKCSYTHSKLRRLRVNNLRVDSLASNRSTPFDREPRIAGPVAAANRLPRASRGGRVRTPTKHKSRVPAAPRARQPTRPQPTLRQQADATPGTDRPRGCPPEAAQVQISFLRLGCPTSHGDRIKTPREPFSSYKRTPQICGRDALRRARHFSFVPGQ